MNDPIELLRKRLPVARRDSETREVHSPDMVQILTAKLLLFTGIGAAADATRTRRAATSDEVGRPGEPDRYAGQPIAWGPAVLGAAAAIAHAVHAFSPDERTRLATRTFDLAAVGVGLLSLADSLAGARRSGQLPSVGSVSLASAGLLGILIDRTEIHHEAERERLERRADLVDRFVPKRRTKLDRVVVHV